MRFTRIAATLAFGLALVFAVPTGGISPTWASEPPPVVTAVPGIGQATVSWTLPSTDADVVSYTATSSPGGRSCTAVQGVTSCIVTGLNATTSYTFIVTATYSATTANSLPSTPAVTPLPGLKVVALGDSVMSGFGFFADNRSGTFYTPPQMSVTNLPDCRPQFFAAPPNVGANSSCSANVTTQNRSTPLPPDVPWAPDYGYWNQVAWSSQFAKMVNPGIADADIASSFRNFGISGATAVNWADDQIEFKKIGDNTIYTGINAVISEQPDIIAVTLGANPSLSEILFGAGNICRFRSDFYGCFRNLILANQTDVKLTKLYTELLKGTTAKQSTVLVTLYPTIIPAATLFTAEQLMIGVEALNDIIEEAVTAARSDAVRSGRPADAGRLVMTSATFNSGLPPGNYSQFAPCFGPSAFGKGTDGPSNQSSATQAVFRATRALFGWCEGTPYIISGDNGIHPNALGYGVMATAAKTTYDSLAAAVPPSFTANEPPGSVEVNAEYGAYRFTATGTPAPFFSLAEGELPPGMQLTSEGFLGGTPTSAGTYTFKVRASNGVSAVSALTPSLQIQVRSVPAPAPSSPSQDNSNNPATPAAPVSSTPPSAAPTTPSTVAVNPVVQQVVANPGRATAEQIQRISPAEFAALPLQVIQRLSPAAMSGVSAEQAQSLTVAQVRILSPVQVAAVRAVTLRAMNPAQVAALKPKVIGSLRIPQVRLLRISQLEALTRKQARQFTARQLAALTPQQRKALEER